ncbi:histone H2A.J-like [Pleurodeles waltl]|uniref:histone H2A.J-like n=1 Tax=Pleurodeles waltl TaxID=8319 RepID=UPI00370954A5
MVEASLSLYGCFPEAGVLLFVGCVWEFLLLLDIPGQWKQGGKTYTKAKTHSSCAGLQFCVGCVHRLLRKRSYDEWVGTSDLVYMTAEILELACNTARDNKKMCIIPRHLQFAIRNDEELKKLLCRATIAEGGVLPNIQAVLLPKKKESRKARGKDAICKPSAI